MKPAISVIIPTYHRNDLLAACLDCLHPDVQTLDSLHYEVIVSDDGQESTAQPMITDHYPWVRWVKGTHKGPAANRNNGASVAQGEWLVFTDDDCLPQPNWLYAYARAIEANSMINVFEGKTVADRPFQRYDEEAPVNETGGNLWSCNFCINQHLFKQVKGFDECFPFAAMEDMDLAARLQHSKAHQLFIPHALIIHPIRPISPAKYAQVLTSYIYFISKHDEINFHFRISRCKLLLSSLFRKSRKLIEFNFIGWRSYVDEHLFIAKTIFISSNDISRSGGQKAQ